MSLNKGAMGETVLREDGPHVVPQKEPVVRICLDQ
jgi:hypothetical protein